MLSRLAAPVATLLKKQPPRPAPVKGVAELLAALADVRARKAALDREERELVAATRDCLRKQQEAVEELKRKVHDCGIEFGEAVPAPFAPSAAPAEGTPAPSQPIPSSN